MVGRIYEAREILLNSEVYSYRRCIYNNLSQRILQYGALKLVIN